ncbi:MAG TPA: aspartate aminotransferase family protein [Actinopolymorphaceae bacterium]|jgi:L-2,4-diaminobutyrate decarboxylase
MGSLSGSPADAVAYLFNEATTALYRQAISEGVGRVAERVTWTSQPFSGVSPAELAARIDEIDLDKPINQTQALDELAEIYLRDAVYFHHPRYLAHLNCPVVIPALLGEAILSAINSSLDTWDQSAGGTLIERRLIHWTATRLGLSGGADGVFTSGGTQSNLQALLTARNETCRRLADQMADQTADRAGRATLPALLPRLRILTSTVSHFSVIKSASLLGLGSEAVITIPCDANRQMRPDALAAALERTQRAGLVPMAVVATAGTTDFGSIDPLDDIADLCERHGVWLHVDAAYGCGLIVSRRRDMLNGIERANSVTVDYHKSFFQPVSSSAVIVRDHRMMDHVAHYADYLNPASAAARGIPNQVDKSLQTTRRFDALKLWLTLRIMGPDAIGHLFDTVIDLANDVWMVLDADPRFEVVTKPQLSTLVFRYVPPNLSARHAGQCARLLDEVNVYVRESLAAAGQAMVGGTTVRGRHFLKFTLLNPRTTVSDVAEVLDLVVDHAERYLAEQGEAT